MKRKSVWRKDDFRRELDDYAKEGLPLWLNGTPSTPKEIWEAHRVAEQGSYMRDYVRDLDGRLIKLEFDSVREQ